VQYAPASDSVQVCRKNSGGSIDLCADAADGCQLAFGLLYCLCLRDFGFVVISIRIIAVQARGFELRNGC
jgi:hypothetical protein